jgi:hypothetical protein
MEHLPPSFSPIDCEDPALFPEALPGTVPPPLFTCCFGLHFEAVLKGTVKTHEAALSVNGVKVTWVTSTGATGFVSTGADGRFELHVVDEETDKQVEQVTITWSKTSNIIDSSEAPLDRIFVCNPNPFMDMNIDPGADHLCGPKTVKLATLSLEVGHLTFPTAPTEVYWREYATVNFEGKIMFPGVFPYPAAGNTNLRQNAWPWDDADLKKGFRCPRSAATVCLVNADESDSAVPSCAPTGCRMETCTIANADGFYKLLAPLGVRVKVVVSWKNHVDHFKRDSTSGFGTGEGEITQKYHQTLPDAQGILQEAIDIAVRSDACCDTDDVCNCDYPVPELLFGAESEVRVWP